MGQVASQASPQAPASAPASASASASASENSQQVENTDKTVDAAPASSTATSSRRISRHLSSLGLLQTHQNQTTDSSSTAVSATTVEREHEPFTLPDTSIFGASPLRDRHGPGSFFRNRFSRARTTLAHPREQEPRPEHTHLHRRPLPTPVPIPTPQTTSTPNLRDTPTAPIAPPIPLDPPTASRRSRLRSGGSADDVDVSDVLASSGTARQRPNEDQAAMLSRLLSVAAAATAASLIGNSSTSLFPHDSSRRHRRSRTVPESPDSPDSENEPVDGSFEGFLRALQNGRLAAALRNDSNNTEGSDDGSMPLNFFRMFRFQTDNHADNENAQRMVPVIIVGIRSVNSRTGDDGSVLSGLQPSPTNTTVDSNMSTSARGTGLAAGRRRRRSEDSMDVMESSSRQRRSSTILFDDDVLIDDEVEEDNDDSSDEDYRTDNEDENDDVGRGRVGAEEDGEGTSAAASGVRSWIIYVLGGQYPEDHPILTTPSLFTDSPTYEDMVLLSSYIGPAKPPVASQDEVDKCGGIMTASQEQLGDRCLVCLSEFEVGETCRKLQECGHLFHQSCIDEWLTTGRNTCPLCRAEGVKGAKGNAPDESPASLLVR